MKGLTHSVIARPFGARRQAIVSIGDTHMVIGSAMIHDTVSSLSQPDDLLLATLATDCTFACQDAAQSLAIPLTSLTTSLRWEHAPGDNHSSTPPSIVVRLALSGPDKDQAAQLVNLVQANGRMVRLLQSVISITFETII